MIRNFFNSKTVRAVIGMWAVIICFDVLWCSITTFRGMSFAATWVFGLTLALVATVPYALCRRLWVQGAVMTAMAVLGEVNIMYCRTYLAPIPPQSYLLAGNLADFTASVTDSLRWADFSFAAIIAAALWFVKRGHTVADKRRELAVYGGSTAVAALSAALVTLPYGGLRAHIDSLTDSCYYTTTPPVIYGIPVYIAVAGTAPDNLEPTDTEIAELNAIMADKERLRPFVALPDSLPRRRSLAVILCESLESWVIGAEIGGVEITPRLNALLSERSSFYAPRMVTQVASGRSIDAQLLLNAGLLPPLKSVFSMRRPDNTYRTLAHAIKELRGGRTYILTGDKPVTWNQQRICASFGIDTLISESCWDKDLLIGNPPKLSDASLVDQSLEKMRSGQVWPVGQAAYVQWVTYSGHNPFRLPDNLKDPKLAAAIPSGWPQRLKDYILMARYTDSAVSRLVDGVRSRPDADSTLILITGDHEGLGADRADYARLSGGLVSDIPVTPFLLVNSAVGGRFDGTIGQIDMYPTLLSLLGLEKYRWKGLGVNILTTPPGMAVSSMTNSEYTDSVAPRNAQNLRQMRRASHLIITHDMLRR